MIPVLYPQSESKFQSNGIGRLTDCISCEVTEERNGVYECEFQYPVTGAHYDDIQVGYIIYCMVSDDGNMQPFDIYMKSVPIDGIVTFNARHISYRLVNTIVTPFSSVSEVTAEQALNALKNNAVTPTPFIFHSDKSGTAKYGVKKPDSIRAMLGGTEGSILDIYGTGEYYFNLFDVYFYLHRGTDTDVEIRYGKNMSDFTNEIDYSEMYNAVVPFWISSDGGATVTLPEKVLQASGATLYRDVWTNEAGIEITNEAGEPLEFRYKLLQVVPMDLSDQFSEQPTEAELRARATALLENSKAWEPVNNVSVDFVQLWQTPEYEDYAPLQQLRLCDTAKVIYTDAGINARMKVIKTVFDSLLGRYSSMELGDAKQSFADVIKASTEQQLSQTFPNFDALTAAIDHATYLITGGGGGYLVINLDEAGRPNELLIMDSPDKNTAVNVWRFNSGGLGHSHNGYDGPYSDVALTMDGKINAGMITTGAMVADRISGGVLASDVSGNYWNLVTGELWSGSNDRSAALIDGYLYLYNKNVQDGYIGRIAAVSENLNITTGGKALALSIPAPNNTTRTLLLLRNGETGSGYSDDVIGWGTWRFVNGVSFVSAVNLGSNKITPFTSGTNHGFRTDSSDYILIGSTGFLSAYLVRVGGSAYIDATLSAQTVTQRSDERLKDISAWDDRYTEILDDLEPIVYRWKDGKDDREYVGIGAQKTRRILDEYGLEDSGLVQGEPDELTVSYSDLTCMLLKKVQEQQKTIDKLEERLARLEASICL